MLVAEGSRTDRELDYSDPSVANSKAIAKQGKR
jgi:hypothetical protein